MKKYLNWKKPYLWAALFVLSIIVGGVIYYRDGILLDSVGYSIFIILTFLMIFGTIVYQQYFKK